MLKVKIVSHDELPDEIDEEDGLSNNGCGKEFASYMLFYYDGKLLHYESDAMEPEDATFDRDLDWIPSAIMNAYNLGKKEEKK